jgi:hypothetical protein
MKDDRVKPIEDPRMTAVYNVAVQSGGAGARGLLLPGVESDGLLLQSSGRQFMCVYYKQDIPGKGSEPAHLKGSFDIATSGVASNIATTSDVDRVVSTVQNFFKP